ncbi:MAG: penicillin-binding protein A [Clostridiales bacterium]|nr:penicillin-binding protein A [Candidatus Cacconaster stercorequi]
MKKTQPVKLRLQLLIGFVCLVVLLYFLVLYNTQVVHGSEYRAQSLSSNATTETIEASRGIITDRNGKVLVSNRLTYTLKFSDDDFADNAETNAAIWRLIQLCQKNKVKWQDTFPVSSKTPYTFTGYVTGGVFKNYLDDQEISVSGLKAPAMMKKLRENYELGSTYTDKQARQIIGVRYELALADYSESDYVFAKDVTVELISQVMDGNYVGVSTGTSSARVYNTTYAAHILGQIGPIYSEDWDKYDAMGYSMNALVGKGGVEEAFEEYLHGTNGTRLLTTDASGKLSGEVYTKEPQPGNTVSLTLDIDLQKAAEDSLAGTIDSMNAADGRQRGGAAAVVAVGSGEVLALASYPSFDPATYSEKYDELLKDERLPLFNRAIDGTYAPGSTFKPCTSVAALETGVITPYTTILDQGIYTYYEYPQPCCWIYNEGGGTHGSVNVTEAITVSCNYFFYEVGRLTGIKTLDDYATQFGLGQHTGIEIGDNPGVLASPEYAEENELDWTDGQTITAAIGQSYNLFTPLQIANYAATLAGGGDHYAAHLLKNVKTYDNSSTVYVYDKEPLNTVKMSESTKEAIRTGMHNLTTGSLYGSFSRCVVDAAAKTGSAQIGTDIANGVFICYAPYDDPQIAVSVVIEKGGSGSALADTAVDILNAYFSRKEIATVVVGENTLLK